MLTFHCITWLLFYTTTNQPFYLCLCKHIVKICSTSTPKLSADLVACKQDTTVAAQCTGDTAWFSFSSSLLYCAPAKSSLYRRAIPFERAQGCRYCPDSARSEQNKDQPQKETSAMLSAEHKINRANVQLPW